MKFIFSTLFVTAVTILCIQHAACQETRDLAYDIEAAHDQLLIHSSASSNCFFRTNDIKSLLNSTISQQVHNISVTFLELSHVEIAVVGKFRDDMKQTFDSANDLLQLEMNTFKGYEERLHKYAENLLVDLTLVPDNLDQLTKDTSTTNSIYQAVENNMNIYANFLVAEVFAIVGSSEEPPALNIFSMLDNIISTIDEAKMELSTAKSLFDVQAVTTQQYLEIVANQV